MFEIKLILFSICLLVATGNANFIYVIMAAFGWAAISYFYQLFLKD